MDWANVFLFLAFTLVTYIGSVVNRRNAETKGEEVKNDAVSTVNTIASDALKDMREARDELKKMGEDLQKERESRAYVEGQVEQITAQASQEKNRADKAQIKMALQDEQITKIYNQLGLMTDEFDTLKARLANVEAERDQLISDKARLTIENTEKDTAYETLMASVQGRIDQAVSDVRLELKQHYQTKISKLEALINAKDEEIAKLKSQIMEETHAQAHTSTNPIADNNPIVLPTAHPSPKRSDAGPTTNKPSQPRSNSGDNTSPTNNPVNT